MFIVHGKADTLIPHSHAEELFEKCNSEAYLHMPHYMDHNEFQFDIDLVEPIKDFIKKIESSKQAMFSGNKSIQVLSTKPEQPRADGPPEREEQKEPKKN